MLDHHPDLGVIIIGSGGERDLVDSIGRNVAFDENRCVPLVGVPIGDLLILLTQMHCLVTACSGASHLGALVGLPIVGLYGPTNPGHTGPYTKNLRVLRLGLKCSPCYRNEQVAGCGDPICMSMIQPQIVFQAVLDCLHNEPYHATPWCETTNATRAAFPSISAWSVAAEGNVSVRRAA